MRWRAFAILTLLAACSSEGPTDIGKIALVGYDALTEAPAPPSPAPSRAEIEATGAAVIAVSAGTAPPGYVAALAENGGYVTYQDEAGRALVLKGGAIARTYGYPQDLLGLRAAIDDPISSPRPVRSWPGQVDREYQFRVRDGAGYSIVLTCLFERGPRQFVEILGRRHEVVEVTERCANARREVANRYWADPETGHIWRSRQWIGPYEDPLTVEIVTPRTASPRW